MAASCTWKPKIKNREGQLVESQLFPSLTKYADSREQAIELWDIMRARREDDWNEQNIAFDSNGEITLKSLIDNFNTDKWMSPELLQEKLGRELGTYKKASKELQLFPKTNENRDKLTEKVIEFNERSPFNSEYVALLKEQNGQYYISVERKNGQNSEIAKQVSLNKALNEQLMTLLNSWGISVGSLTELEEKLGLNGITDFEQAQTAANGLIQLIRIAKGERGQMALPEEFAHFVLRALENNPLIKRLIKNIAVNGLAKEILGEEYENYVVLYNNNEALLNEEAAGKLLAKHLLTQEEKVPNKPYKNIFQKVVEAIKNFFSKFNESDVVKAMREADKDFGILAKTILNGEYNNEIDIKEIRRENHLYNATKNSIDRDNAVLKDIIETELKRYQIYSGNNAKFKQSQTDFIRELEKNLEKNSAILGINTYLSKVLSDTQSLKAKLQNIGSLKTVQEKAQLLRNIKNYLSSYSHCIEIIEEAIVEDEKLAEDKYTEEIKTNITTITGLLSSLQARYKNEALSMFTEFIKPIVGDGIEVALGKAKGKKITAEDIIKKADSDISFFERWLDSAANSSDYYIKVIDQLVKKAKMQARMDTIEIMKQLQYAAKELEDAGINDTEWMFEKDSDGNLTGNYISAIDWTKYKSAREAFRKQVDAQYGVNPITEEEKHQKSRAWYYWYSNNRDPKSGLPLMSIYGSKEYLELQKPGNEAKLKYYNKVMEIKEKLDALLPKNYTRLTSAVKIRKDLIERVKNAQGMDALTIIKESIKDTFIKRGDDTEMDTKTSLQDFEGREVQVLPIYFTKMRKGESMNDLSTDVTSTMIAYAMMANDFNQMNKIIDALEVGRDLARLRTIEMQQGGKNVKGKIHALSRTVDEAITKRTEESNFIARLNDYFTMQVYSRYMADEGDTKGVDNAKLANFINRMTALNTYALNLLAGISNVATGTVMMRLESFCKEFFSESDTLKADALYAQEMPAFLAELGNRVKISKIALWDEYFNVMQDYEQKGRDVKWDRKTWFARMFGENSLYFMNDIGEHWMQNRTSLALAMNYAMLDKNGNETNLWEAMEVVPIDAAHPERGARLQIKEGYKKADGTEFTQDDAYAFTRRSAAINQRLHGIYNKIDEAAIQRLGLGRMAMLYRKWMKPSYLRRFRSATYNMDLQAWEEGYYVTAGKFFWKLTKDLKQGELAIATSWDSLSETEKANITRALTETAHFLVLSLILGLIRWSDDKDRPWLVKMAEYQARRLYTELGVMMPIITPKGAPMLNEGLKILKSPAAGINTIEDMLDLLKLMNPNNYETFNGEDALLQKGRFKGESKATKIIWESPLVPMNKTVYKWLHPEDGIPFYKQ